MLCGYLFAVETEQKTASDYTRVFSRFIDLKAAGHTLPVATSMTQDQHGFLWLGTQHGLFRYDGTELSAFRADPSQAGSLSAGWVSSLATDKTGTLWVGTRIGGLNRFDSSTERFQRFDIPGRTAVEITSLQFDHEDQLWVTTYGAGLYRFSNEQLYADVIEAENAIIAFDYINHLFLDNDGGFWLSIGAAPIRSFNQQMGGVLYRPDINSPWQEIAFETLQNASISVVKIQADLQGNIWALTYGQGLYKLDAVKHVFQPVSLPSLLENALFTDIVTDADGGIWLSTFNSDNRGGLWYRSLVGDWRQHAFNAEFTDGLARADLLGLYQDQQGIIWGISQSGFHGLSRFAKATFTLPSSQIVDTFLAAPSVLGVHAVSEDRVWIANREGGIARFNPLTAQIIHWPLPEGLSSVQHIREDSQGQIWVASDKGLYLFDPKRHSWQLFSLNPNDQPYVRVLFEDRQHNLWLGTRGQGVYRLNSARSEVIKYDSSAATTRRLTLLDINTLVEDYRGDLWIGSTDQGLARLQIATETVSYWQQHPGSNHGLRFNGTQLILEDEQHNLWVRAGNINHRLLRDREQPDKILGFKPYLTEDDNDSALEQAVFFRLLYRLHWLSEQQTYLELSEMHGMQSITWIGAWDILGNTIFRGGANGLDYFDVTKLPERVRLNNVQLTGFSLFNQPVRSGSSLLPQSLATLERLTLNYDQDMISIRFASPEYKQPRTIQYRYQLKGFDRDWIATSAPNTVATYTRLPPGKYTFEVSASLPGGQWLDTTSLPLDVLPPWWLSWWFRITLIMSLVLSIGFLVSWKLQQAYQYRLKLEKLVTERTNQLAQQNDALAQSYQQLQETQEQLITQEKMASLGALVAGVAHEINTPLGICVTASSHLQAEFEKVSLAFTNKTLQQRQFENFLTHLQDGLKILQVNTHRAAELVNSFKQVSVDQSSDTLREFQLASYLHDVILSLNARLKKQNCRLDLRCPDSITLYSDPGAIAQIITNLVMNALLHGLEHATEPLISLNVTEEGEHVAIYFADNGIGMSAENLRQLFDPFYTTKRNIGGSGLGAHIVFNLVTVRLQGDIKVSSEPGKGLQYAIRLPRVLTLSS